MAAVNNIYRLYETYPCLNTPEMQTVFENRVELNLHPAADPLQKGIDVQILFSFLLRPEYIANFEEKCLPVLPTKKDEVEFLADQVNKLALLKVGAPPYDPEKEPCRPVEEPVRFGEPSRLFGTWSPDGGSSDELEVLGETPEDLFAEDKSALLEQFHILQGLSSSDYTPEERKNLFEDLIERCKGLADRIGNIEKRRSKHYEVAYYLKRFYLTSDKERDWQMLLAFFEKVDAYSATLDMSDPAQRVAKCPWLDQQFRIDAYRSLPAT